MIDYWWVFGSYTSSASYIINLQTFDAKLFKLWWFLVEIKNIDDKKEIVLEIKSYKDGGGAFGTETYDENGNILENKKYRWFFLNLG